MKAGWIFCKNDGNGNPMIPAATSGSFTNPGEIHTITGGPGGAVHTHSLVGGVAVPSVDREGHADERHTHNIIFFNDTWQQITIGAANHTHDLSIDANNNLQPSWFLLFWWGSDADAAIINADANCLIGAEAEVTDNGEGGYVFGDLDNSAWSGAERTAWETRIDIVLSVSLPAEIINGERLIAWMIGAVVSRPGQYESSLRPTSVG